MNRQDDCHGFRAATVASYLHVYKHSLPGWPLSRASRDYLYLHRRLECINPCWMTGCDTYRPCTYLILSYMLHALMLASSCHRSVFINKDSGGRKHGGQKKAIRSNVRIPCPMKDTRCLRKHKVPASRVRRRLETFRSPCCLTPFITPYVRPC